MLPTFDTLTDLKSDPQNSSIFWALGQSKGNVVIQKSIDNGDNWEICNLSGLKNLNATLSIDPIISNNIYVVSDNYLFKTTNGSVNTSEWNSIKVTSNDLISLIEIEIDPLNSSNLFARSIDSLYFSDDSGENWKLINSPTEKINDIALCDKAPGIIYVASDLGVFESSDNGKSWNSINDGLIKGRSIKKFATGKYLYANYEFGGISRYLLPTVNIIGHNGFGNYQSEFKISQISHCKLMIKFQSNVNPYGEFSIYNISGRIISKFNINISQANESEIALDFSKYPSGKYFFKYSGGVKNIVKSFLVIK